MSQDFYLNAAQQRAAELEMELSAAKTDLLTYRHNQDIQSAGEAVQRIANLTAEQSNLRGLVEGYVASQQPRQPEQLSDEERAAKPIHRMNYDDVLEMARTSKYGKDLTWNADMQAGYNEVRARRSRGE
jgi:aspartyl/asparaginyl-tRNA synthetase